MTDCYHHKISWQNHKHYIKDFRGFLGNIYLPVVHPFTVGEYENPSIHFVLLLYDERRKKALYCGVSQRLKAIFSEQKSF